MCHICYTTDMVIISHKSALEYWRARGNVSINNFPKLRQKYAPASLPNLDEINSITSLGLSYPINLMINNQNGKWRSRIARPRIYTGSIPEGCIISIGEGLAVSSPEFCFFQMAGELPLVKLIELGLELSGSYSRAANSEIIKGTASEFSNGFESMDKTMYSHQQLTNVKTIKALVVRLEGVGGQKKAGRALRFIADGSASPMETIIFMLLTLPYRLGGYGLPMPVLNKEIHIGKATKRKSRKPTYKCDLFWPKANFAIDYDSDFYHTGADRIAYDSKRRLDLNSIGINAFAVTSRQIRNRIEFEELASFIARKLGKRLRYKNTKFFKASRELRDMLL